MLHLRGFPYPNNLSITPKCHLLLLKPHSFTFFSTAAAAAATTTADSDKKSFTISYLTNNCGLSQQDALKVSKRFTFHTPEKPNSVITFFKTQGFSDDQIQSIIRRSPQLILSDPIKSILPKLQFLASNGASPSDIVAIVNRNPHFLRSSLKHITQTFELVKSFCPSDQKAIAIIVLSPSSISDIRMKPNLQILLDSGVTSSGIYRLICYRPAIICSTDFRKSVDEIKELGFDPLKYNFCVALLAKRTVSKSQWDAKVDALKSWGFSEYVIFDAFKRQPNFMLRSPDKLNAVMRFWVKELEWDPLELMAAPELFGLSLENRLVPRASVVRYLLSKGLIKKSARLYTPFKYSDDLFMEKYVDCYEEKEASKLLRLYQGKDASI